MTLADAPSILGCVTPVSVHVEPGFRFSIETIFQSSSDAPSGSDQVTSCPYSTDLELTLSDL